MREVSTTNKLKIINDPVYGFIKIPIGKAMLKAGELIDVRQI